MKYDNDNKYEKKRLSEENIYKLIIIGGGAAGLYAGAVSRPGKGNGLILERMAETGKKLLLTGSGQCNLTHAGQIRDFIPQYYEAGKKIRSVLYAHSNDKTVRTLRDLGIPSFEREDGKIFPESLSARQVRDTLQERCRSNGYRILCGTSCTGITPAGRGARFLVTAGKQTFAAENVLVTTGGASVPSTGSDGTFLDILKSAGIPADPLRPALTPVFVQDYPFTELSGISFESCSIALCSRDGREKAKRTGPLLFTHRGFSGPAVLDMSRFAQTGDTMRISYLPGIPQDRLAAEFTRRASVSPSENMKLVSDALGKEGHSLPHRFLQLQLLRAGTAPAANAAETGKKAWRTVAGILTSDTYSVSGTGGFAGSMATRGGVSLSAVRMKTMESEQYPGLYFAGEVLNVDGATGGYNLQFAFSSAACAVSAIFGHASS